MTPEQAVSTGLGLPFPAPTHEIPKDPGRALRKGHHETSLGHLHVITSFTGSSQLLYVAILGPGAFEEQQV